MHFILYAFLCLCQCICPFVFSVCVLSDQITSKTYVMIYVKHSMSLASLSINHKARCLWLLKVLMLYKSRYIIMTKISLSKLTYEICRYHRISLRNKAKKEVRAGGWTEEGRKTFKRGGVTKGSSRNRWVRNLYVTDELFDSNQFNDENIKVIRNYDHGDRTI